jgi:hypothetical protein
MSMNEAELRRLFDAVRSGTTSPDDALAAIRTLPYRDLGFANIDTHRALRQGFAEVVFGQGKSAEQIIAIVDEIRRGGHDVLVTRVDEAKGVAVAAGVAGAKHDPVSRTVVLRQRAFEDRGRGTVLVVSAGTSDLPVAEEAALTAEMLGNRVDRLYDVGVAGLHRLLHRIDRLREATALVVVAGMEGALPSVVGGLVSAPVVAVPTSVGYGASFGGVAALLGMLNSCASSVSVVNIDNGFGGGYVASLINRRREVDR